MAKPYREGKTWSFRVRIKGQDIYRHGFATDKDARAELENLRHALTTEGRSAHRGPWHTTLAQALQDYACERLPMLKGAERDAIRINVYLRSAGLPTLAVHPIDDNGGAPVTKPIHWRVERVPASRERVIPKGLGSHRQAQAKRREATNRLRKQLANTLIVDIEPHTVQMLINQMVQDGYEPATIEQERALLRCLFNYARKTWNWRKPERNPATQLVMPKIDNARDRVLTNREWKSLWVALNDCLNPYVAPALMLLLETSMRCSEALVHATWDDFDATRCVLRLRQGKAGWRDVPLGPGAMAILTSLATNEMRPLLPDSRILPISYSALKAAWNRACVRANITGICLHDLRHTSATRFALELNGNIPVLKIITGHKTVSQLMRYVNIKVDDVTRLLHGRPLDEDNAPAGLRVVKGELVHAGQSAQSWEVDDLPANVVPLKRRA